MTYRKFVLIGLGILFLNSSVLTVNAADISMQEISTNVGIAAVTNEVLDVSEYLEYKDQSFSATWGYDNLGIAQVDGNLNVRAEASTSSAIVGKMNNNAACEILGEEGDFYYIQSGEVTGFTSKEFIVTGIEAKILGRELAYTRAIVQTNGLNVRAAASEDADIITQVAKGEELEVIEELDGWVSCYLNNDIVYLKAEFVEIEEGLTTAMTLSEFRYGMDVSEVRKELCEYALQFVGNPYVWGGTSLTNGADCSGFTLSIFSNYNISLPHYSASQSNYGTEISTSDVQPGDLLFYGSSASNISHVAIYIGNGQIVHASDERTGICISNMNYRTPVKAVSLLE